MSVTQTDKGIEFEFDLNNNSYSELKKSFEKALLLAFLVKNKYNQSKTAKEMNISRNTLRTRLNYYFDNQYFPQSK